MVYLDTDYLFHFMLELWFIIFYEILPMESHPMSTTFPLSIISEYYVLSFRTVYDIGICRARALSRVRDMH